MNSLAKADSRRITRAISALVARTIAVFSIAVALENRGRPTCQASLFKKVSMVKNGDCSFLPALEVTVNFVWPSRI
jgi:hypothetical protein